MENYPGMGILSRKLLSKINQNEEYEKLNKNYIFLYDKLKNNKNIFLPIVPRIDEFIVSPRFPIYVNKKIKNRLLNEFEKNNLGVGLWFDRIPKYLSKMSIANLAETSKANEMIINIPIHAAITFDELDLYVNILNNINDK